MTIRTKSYGVFMVKARGIKAAAENMGGLQTSLFVTPLAFCFSVADYFGKKIVVDISFAFSEGLDSHFLFSRSMINCLPVEGSTIDTIFRLIRFAR